MKKVNKKSPITFNRYQQSLLRKGMAITAHGTHECYGGIIFSQIIRNPSCDLLTSLRGKARKALTARFQEFHEKSKSDDMSDDEYREKLVWEFEDAQETRRSIKQTDLEWIDGDNPRNGIFEKIDKDMWSYFDVRAHPRKFKEILEREFGEAVEPRIRMEILNELESAFHEGMEIDPDAPIESYQCEWEEMYGFGLIFLQALSSQKKRKRYEKAVQSFVTKMLSPILNNYTDHLFYVAAEDTTFFDIGRPYFYPIIAGVRSNGSHEITIFEALNEF